MFRSALLFATLTGTATAYVAEECRDVASAGPPADYSEQGQTDFLLNFFSLATTFSPLHGAIPNEPGTGSMGVEMAVIPPLSCERRLVLSYTKTEDTNKAPVAPRPRISFTFPQVGRITPYAGVGYVPPVTVFGTRNVIVSGELGMGFTVSQKMDLGAASCDTSKRWLNRTPFSKKEEKPTTICILARRLVWT